MRNKGKVLVINICKDPLHYYEFVRPIEDILRKEGISYRTRKYDEIRDSDMKSADKMIICGTSLADNDFLENTEMFQWIKRFSKPVLGICGGSHIIGLMLNKKIQKKEEIGMKRIRITKGFLGTKGEIEVYHLHKFQVLPEIFHKKNLYAVLFHPEVRNKGMVVEFARM